MEHLLDDLKGKIKAARQDLTANAYDRMKEMAINKGLKELEKELRGIEQNLYFDQMRVDVVAEEEIEAISATAKYEAQAKRHFIVRVCGVIQNG